MKRIAISLASAALLWSVSAAAQTPQRGGSAVFVLNQDPPMLTSVLSNGVAERSIGCIAYEGLVLITDDYKIMPGLAKSWSVSPDGLSYSFDLEKTAWHDGKPFTSEDVKFSLLQLNAKYSSVFLAAGRAIDSIETPASDKVVIKLKNTFGPFMLSLTCEQGGSIQPKHVFEQGDPLKNPANAAPVGTGAFKFAEWKHGDFVRMARYDKFHEPGRPYLDEVIGKVIPQAASRVHALIAGEVDLIHILPPNEIKNVENSQRAKVEPSDVSPLAVLAFFNTAKKPLDDKRVRQALMMATDRDYLFRNPFFGVGSIGTQPFLTDITWTRVPEIDYRKMYPFDVAKANALLDEAGVKRGADGKRFSARIVIFSSDYPEFQEVSVALKSMWQAIGVDVAIEAVERPTLVKRVFTDHDFDVTLQVYASYADPALGVARTFSSRTIGMGFGNAGSYSNPEVDALLEKGERATKFDERAVFYKQAQMILAEELPVITLRQYRDPDGASKRLHGLWGEFQGAGYWAHAWLSK